VIGGEGDEHWAIGSVPGSLWVEGSGTGTGQLSLGYSPTETLFFGADIVNVTIVQVHMNMEGVAESEEETVGGYIAFGSDDTELWLNGVSGPPPPFDEDHPMTLDVDYASRGSGLIEIWDYSYPLAPVKVDLPVTYDSAEFLLDDLRIKGTSTSSMLKGITIIWEYSIQGRSIQDRIKLTVYEVEHVYPNDTTKVMISTLHDDLYPSFLYQYDDGQIHVFAKITPVIEGLDVYFRPQNPDPDDGSDYDPTATGDNDGGIGSVSPASATTNSLGEAETVLTITNQYAGGNYIVEASGSSTFEEYEESGLLVAWKRYYIEEDKMYRIGSDLAADFTNDGDSDDDVISVINGGVFSVNDEIDVFDADNSESRTIIAISGNDITVADLDNSYNAGYESGDKGAAVGKESESGGFYEADIEGRTPDAFGSDPDGSDGGCFTEFKILEVDENTVNKVPYRLAMGELFWANEDYRDVWFKNKGEQDYFWVCGAARLDPDYTTDHGQTYHAYNTSYVFVENIEWYEPSFYEAQVIADTTAHEIGHQFAFDAGEVDGYHELVWCHEGSESDRCLMASNCSQYDDYSEFCYDGDNHLMEVRSFVDQ